MSTVLARINAPINTIARAKLPAFPRIPMPAGISPAPTKYAKKIVMDTVTLRTFEGIVPDRRVKAAGKKHADNMGCMKTIATIQLSGTTPKRIVIMPLNIRTILIVCFAPNRSDNHPAIRAAATEGILENAIMILA